MDIQTSAEKQIKKYLKNPSTARFSNVKTILITKHPDYTEYKITGELNAKNIYGDMVKASFYIYLECYADDVCHVGDWKIY